MPAYLIAEHILTDASKFEEYRALSRRELRGVLALNNPVNRLHYNLGVFEALFR